MPSFGVRVSVPVPPDLIPPVNLLSNKPIQLAATGAAGQSSPNIPSALLTPVSAAITGQGYRVDFTVSFVDLTVAEIKERIDAINALVQAPVRPDLAVGKIEVLLGKWALGPNNDLVKIV